MVYGVAAAACGSAALRLSDAGSNVYVARAGGAALSGGWSRLLESAQTTAEAVARTTGAAYAYAFLFLVPYRTLAHMPFARRFRAAQGHWQHKLQCA